MQSVEVPASRPHGPYPLRGTRRTPGERTLSPCAGSARTFGGGPRLLTAGQRRVRCPPSRLGLFHLALELAQSLLDLTHSLVDALPIEILESFDPLLPLLAVEIPIELFEDLGAW